MLTLFPIVIHIFFSFFDSICAICADATKSSVFPSGRRRNESENDTFAIRKKR